MNEDEQREKEIALRKWERGMALFLIILTLIITFSASLFTMHDKQAIVRVVEIQNLIPFQLATIFMLLMVFFYYWLGKILGKATYNRVSWDKNFPQAWDYNLSVFLIELAFISMIHLTINHELYAYLFGGGYTDEGHKIIYLIPYNMIFLLLIQVVLLVISVFAFLFSFSGELKLKTSDKKPWRCRDMWYELLGWKAIYWDDEEHHKRIAKPVTRKKMILLTIGVLSLPVTMFILEFYNMI
jgi:hypothetical protein